MPCWLRISRWLAPRVGRRAACVVASQPRAAGRLALREFHLAVGEDAVVLGRLRAAETRDDAVDVAFFRREIATRCIGRRRRRAQIPRAPKRGRRIGTLA